MKHSRRDTTRPPRLKWRLAIDYTTADIGIR
jgi:hypothetical protein